MTHLDRLVRGVARLAIALAAVALLASLFLVCYSVVMRYFLNQPVPWVDELVGYLLVAFLTASVGNWAGNAGSDAAVGAALSMAQGVVAGSFYLVAGVVAEPTERRVAPSRTRIADEFIIPALPFK